MTRAARQQAGVPVLTTAVLVVGNTATVRAPNHRAMDYGEPQGKPRRELQLFAKALSKMRHLTFT